MKEARQILTALSAVFVLIAAGALPALLWKDAPAALIRANDFYAAQRYEDVLRALQAVPRGTMQAERADFLSGKAAFRLGRFTDAESFLTRALAANPGSARCAMNLALSLYRQGKTAEAAKRYRDVADNRADTDPDLAEKAEMAMRAAGAKDAADELARP